MNNSTVKFEDIIKYRTVLIASFAYIIAKLFSNALIVSAHFYDLVDFIRFNEVHVNRIVAMLMLCIAIDIFKALSEKRGINFSFPTYLAIAVSSFLTNTYENVDYVLYSVHGSLIYFLLATITFEIYGVLYFKIEKLLLPIVVVSLIVLPATKNFHDELFHHFEQKELGYDKHGYIKSMIKQYEEKI